MTNELAATAADRLQAQRLRVIAAIHALAQFLTDFPDVPTPYKIEAWSWADPRNGSDFERLAALDKLADDHEGIRDLIGKHEYTHLNLGTAASHGADLRYTLHTQIHGTEGR